MQTPTQDIFALALARTVNPYGGEHHALVHLWWRAPQQGERLVQVYVDGELYDIAAHAEQREMWLLLDRTLPHRIELLGIALDSDSIEESRGDLLASWDPPVQSQAIVRVVRDEQLPVDAQMSVLVDGVVRDSGALWPADEARSGFGGLLGLGTFGYDDATGYGLGRGELGMGPLGAGGTAWMWRRDDLSSGTHQLDVFVGDAAGRSIASTPAPSDVDIALLPAAAASFSTDLDFTLRWTVN